MKVSVLMGGNSSEREVSMKSGKAVLSALQEVGLEVFDCVYEGDFRNYIDVLKQTDLVFLALHGGEGENGNIQEILEEEGIVYTGSSSKASSIAMNKVVSKELMIKNNLPTPTWSYFDNILAFEESIDNDFDYPVVVKPNGEGSSIGLTVVHSVVNLHSALQKAQSCGSGFLVEQYIPGRELTVGILGDEALPCLEIVPSHDYYDYECKYKGGMSEYICPAELPAGLARKLTQSALEIYEILGCRHYGRVDFLLTDESSFYCLEMNTLPGLTETSLLPKSAAVLGISFKELIQKVCKMAINGG